MTNRPNSYDERVKDMLTSRTFKTIFGTISITVVIAVCVIVCGCAALVAAAVYHFSGFL